MATIYDKFTAIANSIREKTGKTELLTLDDMAYEISTISGDLELNFNIKSYSSEEELLADTPSENTIGIISDVEINGYRFSAIEPEDMVDGMVWIKTDNSSYIAFDIVDGVTVYPISAKQYIGGAWVNKTAKSYQGGKWVELQSKLYLYTVGDQCTSVTGGWVRGSWILHSGDKQDGNQNFNNGMFLEAGGDDCISLRTANIINLSGRSKITVEIALTRSSQQYLVVSKLTSGTVPTNFPIVNGRKTYDLSGFDGEYYIGVFARDDATFTVSEIVLEA